MGGLEKKTTLNLLVNKTMKLRSVQVLPYYTKLTDQLINLVKDLI